MPLRLLEDSLCIYRDLPMMLFLDRFDLALKKFGYTYGALAFDLARTPLPPGVSFDEMIDDLAGDIGE
jgi:hypothetical protein